MAYLENNVTFALKNLFGELGAAAPIKVLKVEKKSDDGDPRASFLLACQDHAAAKVRAALSLQGVYQGRDCAYHVIAAGHTLLRIADAAAAS